MTPTQPFCVGHKPNGEPCGRRAWRGHRVCGSHGAASPQAQRKAQERLAEERARKELMRLGRPDVVTDPIGELLQVAGEATAWSQFLREKVRELQGDLRYEHERAGEQLRAEAALYTAALKQTADVLARIVSLDLEERRLHVEEAKAAIVIRAVNVALSHRELNLTTAQQQFARQLVVKGLGASTVDATCEEE